MFDVTHTFSPSRVLDGRAAWNRAINKDPDGGAAAGLAQASFTAASLGLNMPNIPTSSASLPPEINMLWWPNTGNVNDPLTRNS